MAQFGVKGFDDIIQALDKLGRIDEIGPKMLLEAAPILEKEVIKQAMPHKKTGAMIKSIKSSGIQKSKRLGYMVVVRPRGKDKRGVRNMDKAEWLEFGVKGRPASPFLTTAVLNATPAVLAKMREVFNREVGG